MRKGRISIRPCLLLFRLLYKIFIYIKKKLKKLSRRKGERICTKVIPWKLAGRTLTVDIDRVAKQANGAALMHYGDTTVLSTATASKEPREGIDFFPLSVEYEEKMYAVGKIPGGFNKERERQVNMRS